MKMLHLMKFLYLLMSSINYLESPMAWSSSGYTSTANASTPAGRVGGKMTMG